MQSGGEIAAELFVIVRFGTAKLVIEVEGAGDTFVTAAIAISTFGFLDLAILAPTRVYYAMAADQVFIPALARLHPKYGTPWLAIVIQSTWTCVLALSGSYGQLLNYVVFADWIFFGLGGASIFVIRRKLNAPNGSYRVPAYPLLPAFFVLAAAGAVLSAVLAYPLESMLGVLVLIAGALVWWTAERKSAA